MACPYQARQRQRQRRVLSMRQQSKSDADDSEVESLMNQQRLMGEYNPDSWDPDPPEIEDIGKYAARGKPEVEAWDPVRGEAVVVPGSRMDRATDMDEQHAVRLALRGEFDDLDDDQPLPLLESDMSIDPCEGTQGSWSAVARIEDVCSHDDCPECGESYAVQWMASTLAGVGGAYCLTCEHEIHPP